MLIVLALVIAVLLWGGACLVGFVLGWWLLRSSNRGGMVHLTDHGKELGAGMKGSSSARTRGEASASRMGRMTRRRVRESQRRGGRDG